MAANVNNVDVIFDVDPSKVPSCPHGPTLLFARYGEQGKNTKRFYACSACRDRKECNFYQLEDEKVSAVRLEARKVINKQLQLRFTHTKFMQRLKTFRECPVIDRIMCQTCALLLMPTERKHHNNSSHTLVRSVTDELLDQPTKLFRSQSKDKVFAQYLFTKSTISFMMDTFKKQNITHVLCIGVPSIHETIQTQSDLKLCSLLMDLDYRYMQVYPPDKFCYYNMFNHYFFNNSDSERTFKEFITANDSSKKLAVVVDPPFGCLVDVMAHSLQKIINIWQELSKNASGMILPIFMFLPYFMEKKVLEALPSFFMSDYKVTYMNHSVFNAAKSKTGSPVRIFTNVKPHLVSLPTKDGYWFCKVCHRFSAPENKHCNKCRKCSSKDGHTYIHCDLCKKCVKPSKVHCGVCQRCELPDHRCGFEKTESTCHICGELGHKRKQCPQNKSTFENRKRVSSTGDENKPRKKKKKTKSKIHFK